jgi:hypothetical protein
VTARIRRLLLCAAAGVVLGALAYVLLIGIPYGPQARGDLELARSDRPGQRVLFVGNSLTYYNDMPAMVGRLARGDAAAPRLFVVRYTAPGWDLRRASRHDGLRALLDDVNWDHLVLQERSTVADPFVHELHERVARNGGRTTLFAAGAAGPEKYGELARELPASLALVDYAFHEATSKSPGLNLLADDERHPNRAGSFLLACLFYATLTGRDPANSVYSAGLEPAQAELLKGAAWDAYLAWASWATTATT